MSITIPLTSVRKAKYWCTKHDVELELHLVDKPLSRKDEIRDKLFSDSEVGEQLDQQLDTIVRILARLGHTRCVPNADAWQAPEVIVGPECFICPSAIAEHLFGENYTPEEDTDIVYGLLEEEWPYWVMIVDEQTGESGAHRTIS